MKKSIPIRNIPKENLNFSQKILQKNYFNSLIKLRNIQNHSINLKQQAFQMKKINTVHDRCIKRKPQFLGKEFPNENFNFLKKEIFKMETSIYYYIKHSK